jgi:hypothetical protein
MSATRLRGVVAMAMAVGLFACEREPVVAGHVTADKAGAAGTTADAGDSGAEAGGGGGSSGMAGGGGGSAAGSGGPDCREAAQWYQAADYVIDVECKVPHVSSQVIGYLLAVLPVSFPVSCGRDWWASPANYTPDYIVICPEWCSYIARRLEEEDERLDKCLGINRPRRRSP